MKERSVGGKDLCDQVDQVMKLAVRQAIISHTLKNGCEFEKEAYESIIALPSFADTVAAIKALPEFAQLGKDLESFERCSPASTPAVEELVQALTIAA